jgi:thiamine biosynthesis lipoprotein
MHRRDFLRPRHLAQTAGQVLGAIDELGSALQDQAPAEEFVVVRLSRRAMATSFEIVLPFGTPDVRALGDLAFGLLDELEAQLTVYRETSEVSRVNRLAAARPVPVEAGLFELLELASRIHGETGGAFDVTAGALIKAWGFFRGPRRVPSEAERREVLQRVGMEHVQLNRQGRTVRFLRAGLEINLGSIGKGYALDRMAARLRAEAKIASGLLHGGQSSVYAMGSEPTDPRGWAVGLRHPWQPERRLAVVRLRDQGLGTSAATFQHLEHEGRKLGHVLDPRSGWPAEGMASASVVAPTAAEADALATAFYVLGMEGARTYCAAHPEVGAILLPEGPDAVPVALNLAPDKIEWTDERDAASSS